MSTPTRPAKLSPGTMPETPAIRQRNQARGPRPSAARRFTASHRGQDAAGMWPQCGTRAAPWKIQMTPRSAAALPPPCARRVRSIAVLGGFDAGSSGRSNPPAGRSAAEQPSSVAAEGQKPLGNGPRCTFLEFLRKHRLTPKPDSTISPRPAAFARAAKARESIGRYGVDKVSAWSYMHRSGLPTCHKTAGGPLKPSMTLICQLPSNRKREASTAPGRRRPIYGSRLLPWELLASGLFDK